MSLSAGQQTLLEKPVPKTVYFVELRFLSSTQYVSTWTRNFDWDSHTWIGLGQLVGLSTISETGHMASNPISISLNAADLAWISLALGDDTEYRRKLALVYMCPVNDSGLLEGTPQLCWRGRMDSVTVGVSGLNGTIVLKCETAAYAFKRRPVLRMNAQQQKKDYPTDTGFDYLDDLLNKPKLWLSKRFQSQ